MNNQADRRWHLTTETQFNPRVVCNRIRGDDVELQSAFLRVSWVFRTNQYYVVVPYSAVTAPRSVQEP